MDLLWARQKLQSDPAWTDTDTLRPDILVPELLPTLSGMLKIRPYRPIPGCQRTGLPEDRPHHQPHHVGNQGG